MTPRCAAHPCFQPADWSAWWRLWLCADHLLSVDLGDLNEFIEGGCDLGADHAEPVPPEWLADQLRGLADLAVAS